MAASSTFPLIEINYRMKYLRILKLSMHFVFIGVYFYYRLYFKYDSLILCAFAIIVFYSWVILLRFGNRFSVIGELQFTETEIEIKNTTHQIINIAAISKISIRKNGYNLLFCFHYKKNE